MRRYLELYGKFLLNQVRDVRDVHLRVSNLGFRRQPETRLRPEAVPEGGGGGHNPLVSIRINFFCPRSGNINMLLYSYRN